MPLISCVLYKLDLFRCSLECKQTANCHPRNVSTSVLVTPSCFIDHPSPGHVPQLFCSLATYHPDGEHLISLYLSITAVFIISTFIETPPSAHGLQVE